MASLAYKQAVELDMLSGIIADSFQFSEEDLRRRRAESVRNVKQTNGRISFEKRVRESVKDDDGWGRKRKRRCAWRFRRSSRRWRR